MRYIVRYHRRILRRRNERGLAPLPDANEIPSVDPDAPPDPAALPVSRLRAAVLGLGERFGFRSKADIEAQQHLHYGVLTDEEYDAFLHHQASFGKSHTFYRPRENVTHKVRRRPRCDREM
jgi:hypothetical protein